MPGGSRTEPLVGRTRELEIARELLDTASGGVPQLLVLSGEAGIGKSRLARAITADASSRGAHTLWGAGQEDLSLPYLPLTMALGPLNEHGVWLLGRDTPPTDPTIDPTRAWGEVAEILLAATRSPVVLVIDDLQWIDAASQALLMHLLVILDHAATSRPVRLLTIITVRTPIADGRAGRTLSRLEREPNAVTLELGGLDRAEVRDLLTQVSPTPPSAALVQRVMESTSGSPLLAQSILRRGVHEGRITVVAGALAPESADPLVVSPNELDRAVIDRLAQVSQPCSNLLTVAAFLGDHHPIDEVAALAGVSTATAEALVDEAIDAGLLRDVGARCAFSTSQVRHVLFHAPHRRARQRLHLRLADGLEARGDGADSLAIAHHLSRAGDLTDRERLARWTGLAALQAMTIGAWADAGIAAEQALAAAPVDAPWEHLADLRILLTEAASHDFDLATASRHGTAAVALARDHGDTSRWGRALLPLARTLVTNSADPGLGPSSTQLIQDYLRSCSDAERTIRAQLLSLLSEIWGAANRPDEAMAAAIAARDLLDVETDTRVAAAVQVAEGMARWARLDLPEAKQAYQRAILSSVNDPASPPGIYATVRRNLVDHLAGDVERATSASGALLTRLASTQMWGEHALAAAVPPARPSCRAASMRSSG